MQVHGTRQKEASIGVWLTNSTKSDIINSPSSTAEVYSFTLPNIKTALETGRFFVAIFFKIFLKNY
jgi:hypothetical protein